MVKNPDRSPNGLGRWRLVVLLALVSLFSTGMVSSAVAGLFGNALGGAMQGAFLGGLLDGSDGAQTGAAIGAGVGLLAGMGEEAKKRESQEAARARYEQQRRAMEEQRRVEEAARWETEKYRVEDGVPSNLPSIGRLQPHEDAELIDQIQRSLLKLGYDPGEIDGTLSEKTIVGILAYQARTGLLETGQPSMELLKHMIRNGG